MINCLLSALLIKHCTHNYYQHSIDILSNILFACLLFSRYMGRIHFFYQSLRKNRHKRLDGFNCIRLISLCKRKWRRKIKKKEMWKFLMGFFGLKEPFASNSSKKKLLNRLNSFALAILFPFFGSVLSLRKVQKAHTPTHTHTRANNNDESAVYKTT